MWIICRFEAKPYQGYEWLDVRPCGAVSNKTAYDVIRILLRNRVN